MHTRQLLAVAGLVVLVGVSVSSYYQPATAYQGEDKTAGKPRGTLGGAVSSSEDQKAIAKAIQGLSAAWNKNDLEALLSYWTDDSEYIADTGKVYQGKLQIRLLFKKALENSRGLKQSIKINSVKFIHADVAIEEGTMILASPEGGKTENKYSSLWVKQKGKWLISRVRDVVDVEDGEKPVAYQQLKPLSFMVGRWQAKENSNIQLNCRWAPNQTFLVQECQVKQPGEDDLVITHWIGWDGVNQLLRSWYFDSTGGFSGGSWIREGNTWTIQSESIYGDGRSGSSTNVWKYIDDNTIQYVSKDRQVDEQPLPEVSFTFIRKGKE